MKKLILNFLFFSGVLLADTFYVQAIYAYDSKNYALSTDLFKKSISNCPNCNPESYYYLGVSYQYGYGTSQDQKKAFEMYQKGAKSGSIDSKNGLAECYMNGLGTKINTTKAIEIYKNLLTEEDYSFKSSVMITLGNIYFFGKGDVAVDKKLAYKYFMQCAEPPLTDYEGVRKIMKERCQMNLDILCKGSPWACK